MATSKYDITAGSVLEDFEDASQWTVTGGTAVNDSTIFQEGTKSLKLTSGLGTNCICTKTINLNLRDYQAGYFRLWVPEDNLAAISSIQVILSNDSGFANFYSKTESLSTLHEGLNRIAIGRSRWTVGAGTPSWDSPMTRLRVRVNANVGMTAVVYFDGFISGYAARPKVLITADDGWDSQYLQMYPYMKARNMKGSLYLIKQRIGTTSYQTPAMVTAMFKDGWDILNHTVNHFNMRDELTTQAQVEAEIEGCRQWIIAMGWNRGGSENHLAYPNGAYDAKVLAAMANLNMTTGRTILGRTQPHEIDNRFLLNRQSHSYTASAATYQGYINNAIADCSSIEINYHKIVADGAGVADTECEISQFKGMIDYIHSMRKYIDVVTKLEWYNGIYSSRVPNL